METPPLTGPDAPPVVRTDDARFLGLEDYGFQPHYTQVEFVDQSLSLRMHYIDEGPRDGRVILMLHGQPSWSYLYRKLVPVFAEAGFRAIAVDNVGFGRSDKLTFPAHYSLRHHIDWMQALVQNLDLRDVTLVCQDWGGPIGLGVLAREPERFAAVVAANTILHTGEAALRGRLNWAVHATEGENAEVNTALLDWMRHSQRAAHFVASDSLQFATVRPPSAGAIHAWDAPFPSEWHKAGTRQLSLLIPVTESDEGAAIGRVTWEALREYDKPFLTLFSDSDPPTRGWETVFQERIPGARGQPHQTLQNAGHFWQEDCGAEAAQIIVDWLQSLEA